MMTRERKKWIRAVFLGCFAALLLAGTARADYTPPAVYTDNQWDVLVLIYNSIDAPDYKKSFMKTSNRDDSADYKEELEATLPSKIHELSGGRMEIRTLDVFIIDEPIRSVQPDGMLRYGFQGNIDFRPYLEGHDYSLVTVIAPLGDHPGNDDWSGLSGPYFSYGGKQVYYNLFATLC